jgi:heptosyltransferase I
VKTLILKPSSLGDVIQALPVLRLLKRHRPQSQVYWWIESRWTSLLENDPDLSGVIPFHRQRWTSPRYWPEMGASLLGMRSEQFDWVIDLQSLARSSLVAWLTGGKFTIGIEDPREGAAALYDVAVPRPSWGTHAADWYLAVLPRLGIPLEGEFQWLPERPDVAERLRARWPVDGGGRWVALQPGARWPNKRWPAEHFIALVRHLVSTDPQLRCVVLGGAEDQPLGQALAAAVPGGRCLDVTGLTTLPEMIEWLRASSALVTNDTGPMHAAAALGTPIVALFGPTHPRRTGPYGQLDGVLQTSDLACVPCLTSTCNHPEPLACLRAITPSRVGSAVAERLATRHKPTGKWLASGAPPLRLLR